MEKKQKVEKVCKFCSYSLGCLDCSIPDDVPSNECHPCVYNHPLDDKGYVVIVS